jgi:hypothetical protein
VPELPDGGIAAWLQRWRLPAVVWRRPARSTLPPAALVLERGVAPEAVLAALQRLGVAVPPPAGSLAP